jgi:hypothetical protein
MQFTELLGVETYPAQGPQGMEWQDLGVRARGEGHPDTELWRQRRQLLNEASTRVADAYDALIEEARRRALL